MSDSLDRVLDDLDDLHRRVDSRFRATLAAVGAPPGCGSGCSCCCVDDLTVWQVEARAIERWLQASAAAGGPPPTPGPAGACAFLAAGLCQIYPARPYVCRSQGAVLRWFEGDDEPSDSVERRDTCSEHLQQVRLDLLPAQALFLIGPAESELVGLATRQLAASGGRGLPGRVTLRDLARLYGTGGS
jgi:hypothetical protein